MTATSTLTERYVHEVVRRIPADQRQDVADELRATIADTVEGRGAALAEGSPEAEGVLERDVLTEMGDPIRLAAQYADRPLALIGPTFYPTYVRLLRLLLLTVLPIVTVLFVALDLADGGDVGSAIASGVVGILTVGAQLIAWLTVVFALVERFGGRAAASEVADPWTPDDLPELRESDEGSSGAWASIVWSLVLIGLIVWQRVAPPYWIEGVERVEVLDPVLWSGWIWPILAGLAGVVVVEAVRLVRRRWTVGLAVWFAVFEMLVALSVAWILSQQVFFNPAFLDAVGRGWTVPGAVYSLAAVAVVATSAYEVVKRFRAARPAVRS